MAEYVTTFTKPYPSGYQDLPSEATPVGHEIIESWENAIVSLESYLSENNIQAVSASTTVKSGTKTATITIDGTEYIIYSPSVSYESAITGGTKVGTITVGANTFDVYAPSSSTGGSTVSVVPKTLTGTNIAEITVDGTTYQLYAPTSGGGSGSTVTAEATLTEGTQIGKITIDGVETILYAPTASPITVDSELSATSENAVQNKAIAEEFQKYANGTKVVAKATEANTATTASNAEKVNGHTVGTDVPSNAVFTDTVYDDSSVKASIQNIVNGTTQVGSATKATQDAQGNVIDTTYAKKTEVPQGTVVDDTLSSTSVNPVQNKVVKAEFDQVNSNLDMLEFGEVAGGKNLFDKSSMVYDNVFNNGAEINVQGYSHSNYVEIKPNTNIYFRKIHSTNSMHAGCWFDENKNFISNINPGSSGTNLDVTLKSPSNAHYVIANFETSLKDEFMIAYDAIPYEPYIPSVKMLADEVSTQNESLGNFGDERLSACNIDASGNIVEDATFDLFISSCQSGEVLNSPNSYVYGFFVSKPQVGSKTYNGSRVADALDNVTVPNGCSWVAIRVAKGDDTEIKHTDFYKNTNENIASIKNDLSNLKDGTTPAAKAVADEDGNNIKSTYAKKTEVVAVEDVEVTFDSSVFSDFSYSCKCIGKMCFLYFNAKFGKNGILSDTTNIINIKEYKYEARTDIYAGAHNHDRTLRLFKGVYELSNGEKGELKIRAGSGVQVVGNIENVYDYYYMWGSIQWMIK